MTTKINPDKCPFCSGEAIEFAHDQPNVWVECHECGAQGPEEETLNMASKAWNEARQDEIERLQAKIDEQARLIEGLRGQFTCEGCGGPTASYPYCPNCQDNIAEGKQRIISKQAREIERLKELLKAEDKNAAGLAPTDRKFNWVYPENAPEGDNA